MHFESGNSSYLGKGCWNFWLKIVSTFLHPVPPTFESGISVLTQLRWNCCQFGYHRAMIAQSQEQAGTLELDFWNLQPKPSLWGSFRCQRFERRVWFELSFLTPAHPQTLETSQHRGISYSTCAQLFTCQDRSPGLMFLVPSPAVG